MENESPEQGIVIISVSYSDDMKYLLDRLAVLAKELSELFGMIAEGIERTLHNSICFIDELSYYRENINERTFGYSLVPKYKSQVTNRKPLFIRARSCC